MRWWGVMCPYVCQRREERWLALSEALRKVCALAWEG